MLVLKMKKLQRHSIKVVEGGMEDLIFPTGYFRSVIQGIIIKFDIQNTKMRNTVLFSKTEKATNTNTICQVNSTRQ